MKLLGTRREWWADYKSGRMMSLLHVRQRHGRWYRPYFLRSLVHTASRDQGLWWMTDGDAVLAEKYNLKPQRIQASLSCHDGRAQR